MRIHTGIQSTKSVDALNAQAFTIGNDIVFGTNQYQPHSLIGRTLIAHELAHTIQQKYTDPKAATENTSLESEQIRLPLAWD